MSRQVNLSRDDKPHATVITDPTEAAALLAINGRWIEGVPLTRKEGGTLYAETEALKAWRAARSALQRD
jgi:hypothetical protein